MKLRYLLFLGIGFAFASCSSSYRGMQTTDDVYYSPTPEPSSYVTVTSQDDQDSYNYRNDVQEDWQIRRGINDPRYRSSVTLNFGMGYPSYSPFYSPFSSFGYGYGSPFSSFGYGYGYGSPFSSYGYGYSPYYSPFGMGYGNYGYYNPYSHYGSYSPYYGNGYYSGNGYGNSGYFSGRTVKDNGPRMSNLGVYRNNGTSPRVVTGDNNSRPNIAPVRTMRQPANSNTGLGNTIRRVFTPRERRTTPQNNNSNRRYTPTPQRQPTRRFTPQNNNNTPAPSRVERTPSNNSGGGHAPVRKF